MVSSPSPCQKHAACSQPLLYLLGNSRLGRIGMGELWLLWREQGGFQVNVLAWCLETSSEGFDTHINV